MRTKTIVLILAVVLIFGAAAYFLSAGGSTQKNYVDDNSLVMYFYSPQCEFCKRQDPILEELAKEGYRVKLMDVLAHPEYWAQYEVSGTPTFLAANGDRQVGLTQKTELRAWLESHGARITQSESQ